VASGFAAESERAYSGGSLRLAMLSHEACGACAPGDEMLTPAAMPVQSFRRRAIPPARLHD
jgi:hypothetical protein